MKPSNNKERRLGKLKFIAMYAATIIVIVVLLSGFWGPVPVVKTVIVKTIVPPHETIKYVQVKMPAEKNNTAADSLKAIINLNNKSIQSLSAKMEEQKNTIAQLQSRTSSNKPITTNNGSQQTAEIDRLNKQIQFLDWAVRSQVAITNTLTKENNTLKNKIAGTGK